MPFTPINITNGTTPVNATWGANAQIQYTEATSSFNQDEYTPFVLSGLIASKDSVTASKLDIASGVAYVLQSDNTTRRRAVASTSQTTSAVSSTYYLYVQPDGTLYWATTNTPATNSLFLAQVTTDSSGNISGVTDKRTLGVTLFSGKDANLGALTLPAPLSLRLSQNGSLAGTVVGGVTFGQAGAIANDLDTAALFNGTTGTIVGSAAGMQFGNGAWSMECWVNVSATPASVQLLMFMGQVGAHSAAQLYFAGSGLLTLDTNVAGSAGASATISVNTWHHIVGTWDGTTLKLYIDNVLQTTTGAPGAAALIANTFALGSQAGTADFLSGQMAKCAYYNTTLSSTRIAAHYNARTGGGYDAAVLSDSPARYYKLADAVGATWAADTISPSVSTLVDAGGNLSPAGRLTTLGGQTSVGAFGAPVIVAQAMATHVTLTGNYSVATFTPPTNGLYRVSLYAYIGNATSPATITGMVQFTDPNAGTLQESRFTIQSTSVTTSPTVLNGVNTITSPNDVAAFPIMVYAKAGTTITIYYNDNTGTPNDYVSALIERLS